MKGGQGRTRGSGPRKEGVGPGEEKGKRAKRERWAGAAGLEAGFLGLFWFSFLFFKQTQTTLKSNWIQTKFEFKPYALNQLKKCTSMNAQTS